jgi:hypothetical protein
MMYGLVYETLPTEHQALQPRFTAPTDESASHVTAELCVCLEFELGARTERRYRKPSGALGTGSHRLLSVRYSVENSWSYSTVSVQVYTPPPPHSWSARE